MFVPRQSFRVPNGWFALRRRPLPYHHMQARPTSPTMTIQKKSAAPSGETRYQLIRIK